MKGERMQRKEGGRGKHIPDDAASSFGMLPAWDTSRVICIVRLEGGGGVRDDRVREKDVRGPRKDEETGG